MNSGKDSRGEKNIIKVWQTDEGKMTESDNLSESEKK
jgi:hypothetical protein